MQYRVVIRSFENNEIVKDFNWSNNKREQETIARAVNINLNHDKYYTEIEHKSN